LTGLIGRKRVVLNAVLNGITLGGLYFLVASGFTLIFGLLRNVNLAHGTFYLLGGVFPAAEDRLWAVICARIPYVGSCGALDMVNFGPPDTIPATYAGRLFHRHNPQVTLMRTTPQENARIGAWIGERLNRWTGRCDSCCRPAGFRARRARGAVP
jgi:uncharacterized protein (UPF0261 family)